MMEKIASVISAVALIYIIKLFSKDQMEQSVHSVIIVNFLTIYNYMCL